MNIVQPPVMMPSTGINIQGVYKMTSLTIF